MSVKATFSFVFSRAVKRYLKYCEVKSEGKSYNRYYLDGEGEGEGEGEGGWGSWIDVQAQLVSTYLTGLIRQL